MKFKKIVSAASALTIAASAFVSMGVVANADDTTLYTNDCSSTNGWVGANATFTTAQDGTNSYVSIASIGNGNRSAELAFDSTVTSVITDAVELKFDFYINSNAGVANRSQRQIAFYSNGNAPASNANAATDKCLWSLTSPTWTTTANDSYYTSDDTNTLITLSAKKWYTVDALLNYSMKKLTVTVTDASKNVVAESKNIDFDSTNGLGGIYILNTRGSAITGIDNISVVKTDAPTETTYPYTINYQLDGATVKTKTGNETAGTIVKAETTFTEDNQKYFITDETAPTLTITADGTNTLNVPVRKADTYSVTVNATLGNTVQALSTASVVEGDSYTYGYPKYLTEDGTNKVIGTCDATTYAKTITPTADTTETVSYTAYTGTAYFVEAESVLSTTTVNAGALSGNTGVRLSSDGVTALKIPTDGTYKITTATFCRNANNSSVYAVYKNSVIDANKLMDGDAKGYSQNGPKVDAASVVLSANDAIMIQGDAGNTNMDYILVERTGDATKSQTFTFDGAANDFTNAKTFDISATQDDAVKTTSVDGASIFSGISGEGTYKLAVIFTGIASDMTLDSVTIK